MFQLRNPKPFFFFGILKPRLKHTHWSLSDRNTKDKRQKENKSKEYAHCARLFMCG